MKRIFSSSKYDWIFSLALFCLLSIALFFIIKFYFPYENSLFYKVLILVIIILFIIICIIAFLLSFQYAALNDNGIIFKCLLYKTGEIKWCDIEKCYLEKIVTASSSIGAKVRKIFISISSNGKIYRIIYNKKNYDILKNYLQLYNTNISITEI